MDRIWVCGTQDPGSIPGESTIGKAPYGAFPMVLSQQQSGGLLRQESKLMRDSSGASGRTEISASGTETVSFDSCLGNCVTTKTRPRARFKNSHLAVGTRSFQDDVRTHEGSPSREDETAPRCAPRPDVDAATVSPEGTSRVFLKEGQG